MKMGDHLEMAEFHTDLFLLFGIYGGIVRGTSNGKGPRIRSQVVASCIEREGLFDLSRNLSTSWERMRN
jgi:hypothetical protein